VNEKTLDDLQFRRLKEAAAGFAQTGPGSDAVLSLPPLTGPDECEREMTLVQEAASILGREETPGLSGVEDVSELIDSANKTGVLSATELLACARMMRAGHETAKASRDLSLRAPMLADVFGDTPDLISVAERIESTFDEERDIRDDASPRLGELRARAVALGRGVKERIEKMLNDPDLGKLLQDDYYTLREGRYVLPVKSEDRRFMPGIIHGASRTGHTVFIEPESIVHDNNRLKVVLDQVEVEEYAILSDRSGLVGRYADELAEISGAVWRLDTILARARLAGELRAEKPAMGREGDSLRLVGARNPILLLRGRDVVPVTVEMPVAREGGALVISGPNAGGKSVTLSTIGLCILMTRYGLLPPVSSKSSVPWYDGVFTVVGDLTNMDGDVSTFTGQLDRVRQVLDHGKGRAIALIDELATGTEPRQGEALAVAMVHALADAGVESVVATHYEMLKRICNDDERFANARVAVDPETGIPSYVLELGETGESSPFDVAASAGLSEEIIDHARSMIDEKELKLNDVIAETEALKSELLREKEETVELKRKLEKDKARYESELNRLRRDSDRLVHEARREVLRKMKILEDELDEIGRHARKEEKERQRSVSRRKRVREKKAEVSRVMEEEAPLVEDLPTEPFPVDKIKPGAVVYVYPLRATGRIVEIGRAGKSVVVQLGLMKSNVKVGDLRRPEEEGEKRPAKKKMRKDSRPSVPSKRPEPVVKDEDKGFVRTPDNTLDVRGERVDDAIALVDKWLDSVFLKEIREVMIIHGMGTSALRHAIRNYLGESTYCESFRAGESHEGGQGVTMVIVES